MQSLLLSEKKKKTQRRWGGNIFLNELQIQPITGGHAGHRSSCKQAAVLLRGRGQLHQDELRRHSAAHTSPTLTHSSGLDASMWLLSASERPASSLKHVNIKRGTICSECGHSLSRPTVDNRTCFHITVRGSRQMIKVGTGSIGKSNTSPTNGGISAGAGVFVIQVLFLSEHQDFFFCGVT